MQLNATQRRGEFFKAKPARLAPCGEQEPLHGRKNKVAVAKGWLQEAIFKQAFVSSVTDNVENEFYDFMLGIDRSPFFNAAVAGQPFNGLCYQTEARKRWLDGQRLRHDMPY